MSSNRTSSSTFGAVSNNTAPLCCTAAKRALPLSIPAVASHYIRRCLFFQYILFKFIKTEGFTAQTDSRASRPGASAFAGGRSIRLLRRRPFRFRRRLPPVPRMLRLFTILLWCWHMCNLKNALWKRAGKMFSNKDYSYRICNNKSEW